MLSAVKLTLQVIEPVLDSSRYFVMRIEKDRKKAYIGVGFQERSEALDFKIALQGAGLLSAGGRDAPRGGVHQEQEGERCDLVYER